MSSPVIPGIQATAGPFLLGYVFNWGLYGALSVQVYMYYMSFSNDRFHAKALVFGLYLLETAQTIISTHDMFRTFAIGFGDPLQLRSTQLDWLTVPLIGGIVSCTVQIFYAYRISILSRSKVIAAIIVVIALTQGAAAITQGVQAAIIGDFTKLRSEAFVSVSLWLSGSVLCDIMIAVIMSYYLSRSNSSVKATRVLVNRLIRLTIETGSLTAVVAVVDIILFFAFPLNNYFFTPSIALAKLYTNTLVFIFNSRAVHGRELDHQPSDFITLKASRANPGGHAGSQSTDAVSAIQFKAGELNTEISIQRETLVDKSSNSANETKFQGSWEGV
ncbi:hypothetical protein CVT26_003212 [Gymnopilus dilepis]|uniref:DUF6534 domain-containing protein n=1 Tax=Gymnopilus dilepis TaxID=231916 RepID=A0A409Y556_9AGAR|nr:hypothetical protein CVT26_003212 [Gymnopilus dilepis]